MARKRTCFGLLAGLLILTAAGGVVSRKVGTQPPKPAPKNPPTPVQPVKRDADEADLCRQLEREIERAGRIIHEGRERARQYPASSSGMAWEES